MDARRIKKFDHILAFGETVFLGWGVMPRVRQTSKSNPAGAAGHLARYVALLRAVNVGGSGVLAMEKLCTLLGGLGYSDISTILQSGNVVFSATEPSPASIEAEIEREISRGVGHTLDV